jgi:hypothetical protein
MTRRRQFHKEGRNSASSNIGHHTGQSNSRRNKHAIVLSFLQNEINNADLHSNEHGLIEPRVRLQSERDMEEALPPEDFARLRSSVVLHINIILVN